jgi:hypothetical protein
MLNRFGRPLSTSEKIIQIMTSKVNAAVRDVMPSITKVLLTEFQLRSSRDRLFLVGTDSCSESESEE